ncbi:MAG: glucosamine 6-phosphate synthetase [Actinomycetota bacterium]|nr:glucosamine 6-phosphate synthetase [Actinomycetota bacterium]
MCGIFGIVSNSIVSQRDLRILASHAEQRGKDSSGLLLHGDAGYRVIRSSSPIKGLLDSIEATTTGFVMGHSRLVTNGLADNQPVVRDGVCVIHNGIVVNDEAIWPRIGKERELEVDSEVIAALAAEVLDGGGTVEDISTRVLEMCEGTVATAVALPSLGKLCLFSNNGSLHLGVKGDSTCFASESFALTRIGCTDVRQIKEGVVLDIPVAASVTVVDRADSRDRNLIPNLGTCASEERLLEERQYELRRCTKCILPETMPFIQFDHDGVCNYCAHYTPSRLRPKEELLEILTPYRRPNGEECIVPFSGGRDSSYALHLIVNELNLRPITYTYDWGMVTDLGRRNISRMCAQLGVENIVVAADIAKKRRNIALNLAAWLKSPNLGMISILTAGDKHFFQHVETVKEQTGIELNLWGINPLETTHFKAGFLGVPPDFEETRVYTHGVAKQLRYQSLRLRAMLHSPGYFNRSLWDTLSGEYYRSFQEKSHYLHVFDYWHWDERTVDESLQQYDWEKAPDTQTTWRIGDGTAAFYNYVYYTAAGFTEHDTFRSNQIREGDLGRAEALALVADENRPRYPNIKWYLDAIGMDFREVIQVVNAMPRPTPSSALLAPR